ncbi:MAG TPA: toll/interleukin-1 receptor domain-containing protein [bacterium]|nr:toll/interleukin-1 receptor domain-containing protein [bacterium]
MAWKVFYSYAHEDRELRNRLSTYLKPLVQQNRIIEWHDRLIKPGAGWEGEISERLATADLILFLVSADFLASDYCFDVEVNAALERLKAGRVQVVPILLRPCLWENSRFSELQIIPRDAQPLTEMSSLDRGLVEVAKEIQKIVAEPPPAAAPGATRDDPAYHAAMQLVREQVRAYAHLYERIRQRMPASWDRTKRMGGVFERMRGLATAAYPLLKELIQSPTPGERMAAVAILQVFASEASLPFLVRLVEQEKPFIQYQAIKALHFAVEAIHPQAYPRLLEAIGEAKKALAAQDAGDKADRVTLLNQAEAELRQTMQALAMPAAGDG